MTDRTSIGDWMKSFETKERFIPGVPIIARIDGRAFHSFTRGMDRPYDIGLIMCLQDAMKFVFEESNARIGYHQSDEISLLFYSANPQSQVYFDGRKQKMISMLAADVTSAFTLAAMDHWPEKVKRMHPRFDCRVYQYPVGVVPFYFRWRVRDAVKNSISMAASHYYSNQQLHGKNSAERQDMLIAKGVNWNNYPRYFKEGTFIQKRKMQVAADDPQFAHVPREHRPQVAVERNVSYLVDDFPGDGFESTSNMYEFLFEGARPATTFPLDNISSEAVKYIIDDARKR